MFELLETNTLISLIPKILKHFSQFLSWKLYPLIFLPQKLYKLVLFQLPSRICIDLINKILSLFFIDFQITCFKHLYNLVFGYTSRIISIKFHKNTKILFFGPVSADGRFRMWHFLFSKWINDLNIKNRLVIQEKDVMWNTIIWDTDWHCCFCWGWEFNHRHCWEESIICC